MAVSLAELAKLVGGATLGDGGLSIIGAATLSDARPGEITGEGTMLRKGRSIAFMEGRLFDPHGNLLTTASATGQIRAWPALAPG